MNLLCFLRIHNWTSWKESSNNWTSERTCKRCGKIDICYHHWAYPYNNNKICRVCKKCSIKKEGHIWRSEYKCTGYDMYSNMQDPSCPIYENVTTCDICGKIEQ